MKLYTSFILLCFVFVLGCTQPDGDIVDTVWNDIPFSDPLEYKNTDFHSDSLGSISAMEFLDDQLIVSKAKSGKYYFQSFDTTGNSVGKMGVLGEGPGELDTPTFLFKNLFQGKETLFLIGDDRKEVLELLVENCCFFEKSSPKQVSPKYTSSDFMEGYRKIYLPTINRLLWVGSQKNRFVVTDLRANMIQSFGKYPFQNEYEDQNIDYRNIAMAFQGAFRSNLKGDKIVFATKFSNSISFLKVNPDSSVSMVRELHFNRPDVTFSKEANSYYAGLNQDAKLGYTYLYANDEYVYALHSGKKISDGFQQAQSGDTIEVFAWDGSPVYRIKLAHAVRAFAIHSKSRRLYAFLDLEIPEIVYYDLPKYGSELSL